MAKDEEWKPTRFKKGKLTPEGLEALNRQLTLLKKECAERKKAGRKPLKKTMLRITELEQVITEMVVVITYSAMKGNEAVGLGKLKTNLKYLLLGRPEGCPEGESSYNSEATSRLVRLLTENKDNPDLKSWTLEKKDLTQVHRPDVFKVENSIITYRDMGGHQVKCTKT